VGRTLLSASFDFDLEFVFLQSVSASPPANKKRGSQAALSNLLSLRNGLEAPREPTLSEVEGNLLSLFADPLTLLDSAGRLFPTTPRDLLAGSASATIPS
jgi:hypothetical protein